MKALLNGLQAGNRSGTGNYSAQLARWLPQLAGDMDIAVLWPKGVPLPEGAEAFSAQFHMEDTRVLLRRLLLDQFGVRRLAERLKADLVHFPASVGNQMGGANMVVTIHDLSFMRNANWFRRDRALYYRATIGRSAKLARRVIADSQCTAADLQELLGIPKERIDVVPLGVDASFRRADDTAQAAVRRKYRFPARFFLYVGTIEPRKNLERVIAAWSSIAGKVPVDLVIAGRDGWKFEPVHAAAARSLYAGRIHFTGFIDTADLAAMYSCADALVWPSLWEGFGLPPLEAMACEVPVLTANTSSLPEVTGDAAVLVDPEDVRAIAQGMTQLAEDGALRAALIEKGLARSARFTWRRTAELTLDAYRAVVNP